MISLLALLSIAVQCFWCRYLCSYGALPGLFSWPSPMKVYRSEAPCTDCGICDRVRPAPSLLHFGTRRRAVSPARAARRVLNMS